MVGNRRDIKDAVGLFFSLCQFHEFQYVILVNLLLDETLGDGFARVLFHVATEMYAIKDIKGNACVL